MNRAVILVAVPVAAVSFFLGMKVAERPAAPPAAATAPASGTPVATFAGTTITAEQLKAEIEQQTPFVRARYAGTAGKKEFLEAMVRAELLAREAQGKGYDKDPEVVRQNKAAMAQLFLQKEFEEPQQKAVISDEDAKKYYEDHKDDFVKPERVRIADIFFEAKDAPAKAKKRAAAEEALKDVKEREKQDYLAFGTVAKLRSEDPNSRAINGDLHFLSREQLEKRAGKEVADVAFGMQQANQTYDGIIETANGFHIIKFIGREAAMNSSYEDVAGFIKQRLSVERRNDSYNKFVAQMEQKAQLKIDDAALDKVQISLAAPTPPEGHDFDPKQFPRAPEKRAEKPGDKSAEVQPGEH